MRDARTFTSHIPPNVSPMPLKLTPHSFQPKLDLLQLLSRRLPVLEHSQQLLHFFTQLFLHKILFQQPSHGPRQEVRVLTGRGRRRGVILDPQLKHILFRLSLRRRLANDGYLNARKRATTGGPLRRSYGKGCCLKGMAHSQTIYSGVFVHP